jgi:uncharacterized protein YbaR (Trm112 family)
MKRELMSILACPGCKGALGLSVEEEDPGTAEVMEGALECSSCGSIYRISGGIPDLRPLEVD